MKSFNFVRLLMAAIVDAATGGATVAPAPELSSPKLTELKGLYAEAWKAMLAMTDPFSKETKDAKLAVWKIEGDIKAEEQRIVKEQNDAKLTEQRNKRLELNKNQLSAYATLLALQADKKAKPEDVQTAQTAFDTAKELVDNELLAKYAASSSAKKSQSDKDAKPETGEAKANKAAIIELFVAGKTQKEIEEMGYARSTVWHTIDKYKKANAQ